MRAVAVSVLALLNTAILFAQSPKSYTEGLKTVFSDGFSGKSLELYQFADSTKWVVTKNGKSGKDLKFTGETNDLSKTFVPNNIALIKGVELDDFVMEFDLIQRGKNFSLRDICVVYGYTDANNFCFAQAASEENKHTHNVFCVDGGRARKIGTAQNQGVLWAYEKWQTVMLVRQSDTKSVKLFVDGQLVVETSADESKPGLIGFGTFGSEFKIDNLKVWAPDSK